MVQRKSKGRPIKRSSNYVTPGPLVYNLLPLISQCVVFVPFIVIIFNFHELKFPSHNGEQFITCTILKVDKITQSSFKRIKMVLSSQRIQLGAPSSNLKG